MSAGTLVIGGGISGLSVALALLRRGQTVTVLDRAAAGGESSWAGGGILSPLLPWEYGEPVFALALRSMAAFPAWVADIEAVSGKDAEYWRCGMLALGVAEPDRAIAWCEAHQLAASRACPTPPARSAGALDAGQVWLPEVAQVRNPRLVAALKTAVQRLGGTVRENCPAVAVRAQRGRVTTVQTPGESFDADSVVIASGAWAGQDLPGLAPAPNIRPMRGQMVLFELEPGTLQTVLYRNGLYLIPRRDGHLLVGSTVEDAGFDKATDAATLERLHVEAAALLPVLADMQPVQQWAGLRPGSPDNIPVIDRHPDFENVYVNAGHFRYGVTMAPASAGLLAALMAGERPEVDPAPYSWRAAQQRWWKEG